MRKKPLNYYFCYFRVFFKLILKGKLRERMSDCTDILNEPDPLLRVRTWADPLPLTEYILYGCSLRLRKVWAPRMYYKTMWWMDFWIQRVQNSKQINNNWYSIQQIFLLSVSGEVGQMCELSRLRSIMSSRFSIPVYW